MLRRSLSASCVASTVLLTVASLLALAAADVTVLEPVTGNAQSLPGNIWQVNFPFVISVSFSTQVAM